MAGVDPWRLVRTTGGTHIIIHALMIAMVWCSLQKRDADSVEHAARKTSSIDGDLHHVLEIYRLIALKRPVSAISEAIWLHDFEGGQLIFREEETVSLGLERALAFLQPRCPSGLLLCAFASSARSIDVLYGSVDHVKLVSHGRSNMADSILRLLCPYLLRSHWQISDAPCSNIVHSC